jgi:translation initiation factor eIF-2B subunit beta
MTESLSGALTSSDPAVVRAWLARHHRPQLALLDRFLAELRLRRQTDVDDDRRKVVLQTVELLKHVLGGPTSYKSAAELLWILRAVGYQVQHASNGREPANVIRRIMAAVRQEAVTEGKAATATTAGSSSSTTTDNRLSLQSMLWALPQHIKTSTTSSTSSSLPNVPSQQESLAAAEKEFPDIYYKERPDLKQSVMEILQETLSDLEDTYNSINEQVTNHIHAGEVILTCGKSRTTEAFLKAAALKRKIAFQVVVCEGAPGYGGHQMARSLADAGIDTVLIHDAAIFAVMARVHKVLLPAHAVLANGGMIASSGANLVALAARHHSVPVVCLTGIFKLCPVFPHDGQDTLNDLLSPAAVMEYAALTDRRFASVEFVNPLHDYIPPDQVNLYVTNVGSFQPSFIYRLLAEYSHTDDWSAFD